MHVLSISLHSVEFAEVVQDINYELDIFAYEDNPAASWIWSRPPELDVRLPKTISKAKAIISECHAHHSDCEAASPPRLPTRVINVQESTSLTVYLHTSEGTGEFHQYIALGYCWGGDQPVVALKHNLDDLRSGITVATLPQTLQDAVQTTRDLGYRAASWSEIIRQYTYRNLTFPGDRSRAITGIIAALEEAWDDKSKLQRDCVITADLFELTKGTRLTLSCRVIPEHEWPTLESNLFNIYKDIEEADEFGGIPQFYLYLRSESHLSSKQWHHAFALIVIEEEIDIFRRIGLIEVHSRNIEVVRDLEQRLQATRHVTLI
ncbi:hypothetical protein G7Y89_g13253 [Cudoniella acicularis]|uniref:Heterokaryon incompatibility domain-containing protein n=1 Tax=Cudoniella acicularis TaxID=354080 RepID=A0A8H4R7S0_9HELO|nr:hypothetical protein G7Y89_g13253 [Cudoniella acicularis]